MTVSREYDTPASPTSHAAPAASVGSKVSAGWTGALMMIGAIVAAVGTFLPFEKLVVFFNGKALGASTFTGLGSQSRTGRSVLPALSYGNSGKIILVLSVLLLVAAALTLAKKGRLWVGIVSLLMAGFAAIVAAASFGAPKSDAKTLAKGADHGFAVHGLTKIGIDLAVTGAGIAVVAAILAICVRRRRTA